MRTAHSSGSVRHRPGGGLLLLLAGLTVVVSLPPLQAQPGAGGMRVVVTPGKIMDVAERITQMVEKPLQRFEKDRNEGDAQGLPAHLRFQPRQPAQHHRQVRALFRPGRQAPRPAKKPRPADHGVRPWRSVGPRRPARAGLLRDCHVAQRPAGPHPRPGQNARSGQTADL